MEALLVVLRPRRLPWRTVAAMTVALVTLFGCGSSAPRSESLPSTDLVRLDNAEPTSFDAYRGTPLVVNLWASWCTPCRTEMPAFEAVHQRLGDRVAIVGVTDDPNRVAAKQTAAVTGVTYPLLIDTDGRLLSELAITGLPATIFVGADGRVLETHAGRLDETTLLDEIGRLYGPS